MRTYIVRIGDTSKTVSLKGGAASIGGLPVALKVDREGAYEYRVDVEGAIYRFLAVLNGETVTLVHRGTQFELSVQEGSGLSPAGELAGAAASGSSRNVTAPMPALVTRVEVKPGDAVEPGKGLLVLEAMKMENEIKAHVAGVVDQVHVTAGKAVEKGELLVTLR